MKKNYWSEEELILSLHLYLSLSYEEIHLKNNAIISLARLTNRSIGSIHMRLMNYVHCDPSQKAIGRKGLDGGYNVCQPIWDKYAKNSKLRKARVREILNHIDSHDSDIFSSNSQIIKTEKIWWNILSHLEKYYSKLEFSGSNPFLLEVDTVPFYVFLRNLTRAYTDKSPDVYRIQLPRSPKFEIIKNSEIPLVILGYCDKYKTFAFWNSEEVKPRLNGKGNVSLYSRLLWQVPNSDIETFSLSNGTGVKIINHDSLHMIFEKDYISWPDSSKSLTPHEDNINSNSTFAELLLEAFKSDSDLEAIKLFIDYYEKRNEEYSLLQIKKHLKKLKKDFNKR